MTKSQFLSGLLFQGHIHSIKDHYVFYNHSIYCVTAHGRVHHANVTKVTDKFIYSYTSVIHSSVNVRVPLESLKLVNTVSKEGGSNV